MGRKSYQYDYIYFRTGIKRKKLKSSKVEIVPEYLLWDQEKLFDEETNTQKSRDSVPLDAEHGAIIYVRTICRSF